MSEENNIDTPEVEAPPAQETPNVDELVAKAVEQQLAKIKGNLDKAYDERDEYRKEAEELKKAKQDLEIKSLEDQGKATEALEARLKQQEESMKALMEQNTRLSRDTAVREQLAALEFSGEKAAAMAANDITGQLKRTDDGQWVGQNGESIGEVIQSYAADESNGFLFKQKVSQGSQTTPQGKTQATNPQSNKTLSQMTDAELLEAAEAGQFDGKHKWLDF